MADVPAERTAWAELHEALAQSVELLNHSLREQGRNINRMLTLIEAQTSNIEGLQTLVGDLVHVVESHERRRDRIEGRPANRVQRE